MADIRSGSLYGTGYDRFVERYDESTLSRMQKQYWEAKQVFMRKLKRKEDDCVVASDSELDAKLELFRAIEDSCTHLLCILEGYQDRLCALAHEESATGRFLKESGKLDKTRAGKMMAASGKTLCYGAQQRIQLRNPLVRLYQEVETFQYRAITDTYVTIDKMEKARTAYRGALLWMKDVSQELDPDTYKQLEKFRKVQGHVRRSKQRFDKLKLDTLQKIDMLSASRCNMFSHSLAAYQNGWLVFWEKSSRAMAAVSESFKGYQYYEFNMLKELTETSKKLSDEASSGGEMKDAFDENEDDKDRLIFFDAEYHDDDDEILGSELLSAAEKAAPNKADNSTNASKSNSKSKVKPATDSLTGSYELVDLDKPASAHSAAYPMIEKLKLEDILTSSLEPDVVLLLNEILNPPPAPIEPVKSNLTDLLSPSHSNSGQKSSSFLPSQLLDMNKTLKPFSEQKRTDSSPHPAPAASSQVKDKTPKNAKGPQSASNWFNLFAELDPLANPDAIGTKGDDDRNC